ncbi:MAG TPA: hypothetical protein VFG64_06280 [Dongiaceae bacterium]|nr:hypothetical protein [Dongiaceae bacterium]
MRESRPLTPRIVDRRATIVVLAHEAFGLETGATLSTLAAEHWMPAGHRFLVHQGPAAPPPADLAVVHVPLTRLPPSYSDLLARYPRTINASVTDVSKRRIATDLVTEDEAHEGPVIVKTDLNHGGAAERRLRRLEGGVAKRLLAAVERHLPPRWTGRLPGDRYLMFGNKREVPHWIWRSPGLIVQPFHVERRGDLYALHQWYFLGGHECVSTFLSRDPVVKLANVVERLPLHQDVPEAIRRRRAELKFDYGKFDYVVSNGVPILLDANPTPTGRADDQKTPRVLAICSALAGGLAEFLR